MKVFVDTNVLMDLIYAREPFDIAAKQLFLLGYKQEVLLNVSALSFVNTVYTAHKYGLDISEVKSKLHDVSSFVIVLDYSGAAVVDSLSNSWADYEDSTQYLTAKYLTAKIFACDCIVSRDKKGFKDSSIKVMTPQEFLGSIAHRGAVSP